jgi:hypothetical protein
MPGVLVAFVHHLQPFGGKGLGQAVANSVLDPHFSVIPPSSARKTT